MCDEQGGGGPIRDLLLDPTEKNPSAEGLTGRGFLLETLGGDVYLDVIIPTGVRAGKEGALLPMGLYKLTRAVNKDA